MLHDKCFANSLAPTQMLSLALGVGHSSLLGCSLCPALAQHSYWRLELGGLSQQIFLSADVQELPKIV